MKKIWLKMLNASTINNLEYVTIPFSLSPLQVIYILAAMGGWNQILWVCEQRKAIILGLLIR